MGGEDGTRYSSLVCILLRGIVQMLHGYLSAARADDTVQTTTDLDLHPVRGKATLGKD